MSYDHTGESAEFEGDVLTSALVAALAAGLVAGVLFQATGRMDAVAGVYGFEGALIAWALLVFHSLVAGALFAIIVVPLARPGGMIGTALDRISPFATSTVLGILYGFVLWAIGVAVLLPLLVGSFSGESVSMPYFSGMSVFALLLFGTVLGALFAVVYEQLEAMESDAGDPL